MTRKTPYIPHLAEFSFKPDRDWSPEDAKIAYDSANRPMQDQVTYTDCVAGMRAMPPDCADLVVADPPFALGFSGGEHFYNRERANVVGGYVEVPAAEYEQFTKAWIAELPRVMKCTASAYVFSGWSNLGDVIAAVKAAELIVINHIIWKYQFAVFAKKKFSTCHYHIMLCAKTPRYFFNRVQHYNEDVWVINRAYQPGELKNGTKLPEEVVRKCVDFSSKPGDLVLDPFLGNGTTAVVAKGSYRHYCGFELNGQMRPVIETGIASRAAGADYSPYASRLPTIEQLAKLYPRAYREYLKCL